MLITVVVFQVYQYPGNTGLVLLESKTATSKNLLLKCQEKSQSFSKIQIIIIQSEFHLT